MSKELKKGYTTGAHTSWAFKSALSSFILSGEFCIAKTNKMDNDDLDITKGCEIVVSISNNKDDLTLNPLFQKPYLLEAKVATMELYAGEGVGVVTKKGLKPPKDYPAINPKPLKALSELFYTMYDKKQNLYASVSVTDGKEIAKQTANAKVGVIGGISILGTTGFVKPVSSSAYIDSVATEINFAHNNGYEKLYFTLGNSAFNVAKKHSSQEAIIEIGNFVYDSIKIAKDIGVKEVVFLCGIGKMTKVYQGFKNTHNRFGVIDFEELKDDIQKELSFSVDIESTLTVKGISEQLEKQGLLEEFYKLITLKANKQIQTWHKNANVKAIILEQKEVLGW